MRKLLIAMGCMLLLCGCTKSNIVQGQKVEPDFETKENVEIVWDEVGNSLSEIYTNSEDFPIGEKIKFSVDSQNKTVDFVLRVNPKATKEEAVEYAAAVVRGLADEVSTQDFSYEASDGESYGGFFDEYSFNIRVLPDGGDSEDEDALLVDMNVPAGSHTPIEAVE